MKIGIVGGTFDPIHNGHIMLGEYAYRNFELDEVWFLPNGNPPHKSAPYIKKMTGHRLQMTELAISGTPYFRLCSYEAKREEKSYSFETMMHFNKEYPEDEFYFIIGADSLFTMDSWYHPELLISSVIILAAYRDDMDTPAEMEEQISYLEKKYGGDIRLLKTPLFSVSSSDIREKIEKGLNYAVDVPEKVAQYIQMHHLYKDERL